MTDESTPYTASWRDRMLIKHAAWDTCEETSGMGAV